MRVGAEGLPRRLFGDATKELRSCSASSPSHTGRSIGGTVLTGSPRLCSAHDFAMAPLKVSESAGSICTRLSRHPSSLLAVAVLTARTDRRVPPRATVFSTGWSTCLSHRDVAGENRQCAREPRTEAEQEPHPERGSLQAEVGKGTQTPFPCPTPPSRSPPKNVDDVNKSQASCNTSVATAPTLFTRVGTVIHIVGIAACVANLKWSIFWPSESGYTCRRRSAKAIAEEFAKPGYAIGSVATDGRAGRMRGPCAFTISPTPHLRLQQILQLLGNSRGTQ